MSSKKGTRVYLGSKQKKAWRDPVITRVKLNPEQAVLACCHPSYKNTISAGSMCQAGCSYDSISAANT